MCVYINDLRVLCAEMSSPMVVEGRLCYTKSQTYKGVCFRDANCANVCINEGFTGGKCRGFKRDCYCSKECSS